MVRWVASDAPRRNLKDIPDDAFQGVLLEDLCLAHNELETIPASISQLSTLRTLDLSSNLLKALPSTLPSVVSLTSLKLSRNVLTSLPPNLGELVNLIELYGPDLMLSAMREAHPAQPRRSQLDTRVAHIYWCVNASLCAASHAALQAICGPSKCSS